MRITAHNKAAGTLKNINKNRNEYNIIHYSCESFINHPNRSARITSITISSLRYNQATTYSIMFEAENRHISNDQIDKHYDELEKSMLIKYYRYIEKHRGTTWIHWNMRDSTFGFHAIEHRARTLGIKGIIEISDEKQIDFSVLLKDFFGEKYIEYPYMENLARKNKIDMSGFLNEADEANAFEEKKYAILTSSTTRKVQIMRELFDLLVDGNLKTNAKTRDIYGFTIQTLFEYLKGKWYVALILYLIPIIIGVLCGIFL